MKCKALNGQMHHWRMDVFASSKKSQFTIELQISVQKEQLADRLWSLDFGEGYHAAFVR